MKKTTLLHSELSYLIGCLGHGDKVVIADAGLPVPKHVHKIDLAVRPGIPSFFSVLEAILSEMQVESCLLANEIKPNSLVCEKITEMVQGQHKQTIDFAYCDHEEFKQRCGQVYCIVRTGEFTPYCNIMLSAGVIF